MFCGPGFDFFQRELQVSPYNALEIGIFNGDSISQLGILFPDKKIYGVDPFIEDGNTSHSTGVAQGEVLVSQRQNSYMLNNNLSNVKIYEMTSQEFLNSLTQSTIDELNVAHVLIDGSHHYADVVLDGILALTLIDKKPGTIVFDDVNLPDVGKAHDEWVVANSSIIQQRIELAPHIIAYRVN
jgi:hypothetical protein